MSEDTDDMFDDLLNKYGKVVFKRNDQTAARAEVDDDAESLSCKFMSNYIFLCTISPRCQIKHSFATF